MAWKINPARKGGNLCRSIKMHYPSRGLYIRRRVGRSVIELHSLRGVGISLHSIVDRFRRAIVMYARACTMCMCDYGVPVSVCRRKKTGFVGCALVRRRYGGLPGGNVRCASDVWSLGGGDVAHSAPLSLGSRVEQEGTGRPLYTGRGAVAMRQQRATPRRKGATLPYCSLLTCL